jgi:AcrR family transcriptional regulator
VSDARERILDAAVRRIAREGFDDARIARIATDAGVSPSAVHYHFDSREALLAEALEHSYERAGDVRIDVPEDVAATAAGRLAAMIEQCLPAPGPVRDDFVLWVELWLRAARDEALRPTGARLYARMHEWLREAIDDGVATGELSAAADPGRIADRTLALIDGYGVRVVTGDPAMPLERARREIWSALARDLGLPDEPLGQPA